MSKPLFLCVCIIVAGFTTTVQKAEAHCQVPCGIFADQIEFEKMLEAQTTIAKADAEMAKLLEGEKTTLSVNQTVRWINTKEEHCQKIIDSIAGYFMAQRIKPVAEDYEAQLIAAHNVMRAAMKAKQDPSPEVAEALKESIFDLYRAYEGAEPDFHSHE